MKFEEAVKAMKEGKKVWRNSTYAIGRYIFIDGKAPDIIYFQIGNEPSTRERYYFGVNDIEATDWEIVEEKKERPKNILKIPVKNRTEEEHRRIMEYFYNGNVREYLLSMGEFKDIPVEEKRTLSDKLGIFTDMDTINKDVKEAIKEFMTVMKKGSSLYAFIDKNAKEIFGERLIE